MSHMASDNAEDRTNTKAYTLTYATIHSDVLLSLVEELPGQVYVRKTRLRTPATAQALSQLFLGSCRTAPDSVWW